MQDGTDTGRKALEVAKKHAEAFNGEVIALTSLMMPSSDQEKEAEESLEGIEQIFNDGSVPFSSKVLVTGMHAGEDIVKYAQENNIDEIIIGVKKKSKVGKILFGSTLLDVVLNAPCPVLTIK